MKCLSVDTTPCGQHLNCYEGKSGREYWLNGKLIWRPKDTHRVVLQMAITREDGFKYNEKI